MEQGLARRLGGSQRPGERIWLPRPAAHGVI